MDFVEERIRNPPLFLRTLPDKCRPLSRKQRNGLESSVAYWLFRPSLKMTKLTLCWAQARQCERTRVILSNTVNRGSTLKGLRVFSVLLMLWGLKCIPKERT